MTRMEAIEARVRASTRDDGRPIGHGHVFRRDDGSRARCGGPGICDECSRDHVIKSRPSDDADLVRWVRVLATEVRTLSSCVYRISDAAQRAIGEMDEAAGAESMGEEEKP